MSEDRAYAIVERKSVTMSTGEVYNALSVRPAGELGSLPVFENKKDADFYRHWNLNNDPKYKVIPLRWIKREDKDE